MRYATALVIGFGFLMCGCTSREVTRVTSPNGRLDAIVLESDCGVSCDVLDDVWVVPKGRRAGVKVALFDDAIRNEHAYGVNLKWDADDRLVIEYLRAHSAQLLMRKAVIGGQGVQVTLHSDALGQPNSSPRPD